MNKPIVVGVGVLLAAVAMLSVWSLRPERLSAEAAVQAVIDAHPELASYKTTSLPPSSIETRAAPDGWYVAFIQHGSGLPGVLHAECYHVTPQAQVSPTGTYTHQGSEVATSIALETCAPTLEPAAAATTTSSIPRAAPTGGCYVGGCSGQLCTDQPDAISTCEFTAAYACYKQTSTCGRQPSGQCGWTPTPALTACLNAAQSQGPVVQ